MWLAGLLVLSQSAPVPPAPAPATGIFHGRVVQAEDGAPVAHAHAEVRWNRGAIHVSRSHGEPRHEIVEPPPFPSATTDDAGRFAIGYDTALDPWIVVEAETRGPGACGLLAGHADAAHELVFALPRAARLEIELDASALPIDHRWLAREFEAQATAPLYASSFPAWLGVTSGETRRTARATVVDGVLAFERLPSGAPIEIEFTCDGAHVGALDEPVVLAAGKTRRIRWTPTEPSRTGGTGYLQVDVRDMHGDPAVGATVRLERVGRRGAAAPEPVVSSEVAGRYSWPELEADDYSLTIGGAWTAKAPTLHVDAGSTVTILTQAVPVRSIRGTVVEASGEPVAHAWVEFAPWSALRAWDHGAFSDARGEFVLRVPRDGTGVLRAVHPAISDLETTQIETDTEILPDRTKRSIDLGTPRKLVFPATTKPRIRVVDAAGVPTPAQIRHGPRAVLGVSWRGAAEAELVLEMPGESRGVSAVTPDGRAAFAILDARSESELTLRLAPAGSLRLRHRGAPRLVDARVTTPDAVVYGITTLVSGIDEVVLVPPGDWLVRVDGRADRPVRIEAGVETLVGL